MELRTSTWASKLGEWAADETEVDVDKYEDAGKQADRQPHFRRREGDELTLERHRSNLRQADEARCKIGSRSVDHATTSKMVTTVTNLK